ncbi:MAG: hypothetical protein LBD93_11800 [Treponema sp.]|nr:hypothetical protein [Treponema sp.]
MIVQDTLDAAGITETVITCPAVELARFSMARITADECITLRITALYEYGYTVFSYFFDASILL